MPIIAASFCPEPTEPPQLSTIAGRRVRQLINPVALSNVKLGCVPFGMAAFNVKVDGDGTVIVRVIPLDFLKPTS